MWYLFGMSSQPPAGTKPGKTQITVRLDDSAVALLDDLTKEGLGSSRADALNRLLRRERRRRVALRDAEIYRTQRGRIRTSPVSLTWLTAPRWTTECVQFMR